jgi:NADPH:quinone reductase-like Zn-dependent oxidoreductase
VGETARGAAGRIPAGARSCASTGPRENREAIPRQSALLVGSDVSEQRRQRPGRALDMLAELAGLIADGHLEVPITNVYPLAQVREAYTELERRHTRGKIVLRP